MLTCTTPVGANLILWNKPAIRAHTRSVVGGGAHLVVFLGCHNTRFVLSSCVKSGCWLGVLGGSGVAASEACC
jgi:hypothetical protein